MIRRATQAIAGVVLFAAFCWYIRPRFRFSRRKS